MSTITCGMFPTLSFEVNSDFRANYIISNQLYFISFMIFCISVIGKKSYRCTSNFYIWIRSWFLKMNKINYSIIQKPQMQSMYIYNIYIYVYYELIQFMHTKPLIMILIACNSVRSKSTCISSITKLTKNIICIRIPITKTNKHIKHC